MNEPRRDRPAADTRDRLPLWVIILLAVFLLLRVLELRGDWIAGAGGGHVSALAGRTDTKTMAATFGVTYEAKTAFITTFAQPGDPVPDQKSLQEALKSAETLQTGTGNAPSAARRVIVLRALLHQRLFGLGRNGLDPSRAFSPKALARLPPAEASRYAAEGRLWADIARGPHLTPTQTAQYAAQIRATPNIRWWQYPALSALYRSQGNPSAARHFAEKARVQALLTIGPLAVLLLVWALLGLGGLGLLLSLVVGRLSAPGTPSFWPTMRELVPLSERRLRAGDLMGVFVLYLLMPDLIGWLISGFVVLHRFHFPGLLAPYREHLLALPSESRVAANVVLTSGAYLLGALVPIGVLVGIARRKGASIADELGWNTHRLGWNLLYGVGGYAIGLPLLYLAASVGTHIPGPTPSNPAIPLLANASTVWVQLLLAGLAVIAAPLTEELLFRGVFYNAAKLRLGVWPAILLTGLIFGFVHPVGIAEMLPLAVLGGVFAWMTETRKSLVPSMLGHFLQNSMATLMLLLALGG